MRFAMHMLGLIAFTLLPFTAWAGEQTVLTGEIYSLDVTAGTMQIAHADGSGNELVNVVLAEQWGAQNGTLGSSGQNCLAVGKTVRLIGRTGADDDRFVAENIRGCSVATCNDPTGVRARLYRNKQSNKRIARCRE